MNAPDEPDWLALHEAARVAGLPPSELRDRHRRGIGPQPTKIGGRLRWRRSDLERFRARTEASA